MHDKFSGWNYVFWFVAIVSILFGAFQIHSLGNSNQGLNKSLRTNQSNQITLQRDTNRTTLSGYEQSISKQGNDLYRDLPTLDRKIVNIVHPAYTGITDSASFQKMSSRIRNQAKGDLTSSVLNNAKPQVGQGHDKPISPYAGIKGFRIENKYSNYTQGQVVVLTDVSYTIPGRTVQDGRKIMMPSSQQHDYYLSTYDINSGTFHVIMNNHSQSQGGEGE